MKGPQNILSERSQTWKLAYYYFSISIKFPETAKLWGEKSDQWLPRAGMEQRRTANDAELLGVMGVSQGGPLHSCIRSLNSITATTPKGWVLWHVTDISTKLLQTLILGNFLNGQRRTRVISVAGIKMTFRKKVSQPFFPFDIGSLNF